MQTSFIIILGILYLSISIYSAIHALLNKRDSRSALGWLSCCLFVPYLGPLLYLVFGINRTRSYARSKRPENDNFGIIVERGSPDRYPLSIFATVGKNVTKKDLLPCKEIEILINGNEAYPKMLEAISTAKFRVSLSTYILSNDVIGKKFLNALSEASNRGIEVKVLVDGLGEYMSIPRIGKKFLNTNVSFSRFNPIKIFPFSLQINMRNHRKILVVDGQQAFTGGMNITEKTTSNRKNKKLDIQDIHFKLSGLIASDIEYAFNQDWSYSTNIQTNESIGKVNEIENNGTFTRLILDGPNQNLDKLTDVIIGNISLAKLKVWIVTPYFLPSREIIGALQAAKLRNIDVKIVLPEINNIKISHWATRNLLWNILIKDIDVYYQKGPFSHAKLLIIDNEYSLIGSANIDPRSLRLNFELGVEIFSNKINNELKVYIEDKITNSKKYSLKDLQNRSVIVRLRDSLAGLFTPYL